MPALLGEVVEIKRRIYEVQRANADHFFDFEFPEFIDAEARIASQNMEAWGLELRQNFRVGEDSPSLLERAGALPIDWLVGRYEVIRRDAWVLSLEYKIEWMPIRAAHRSTETRVQNFLLNPFQPLELPLLCSDDSLGRLAQLVRANLMSRNPQLSASHMVLGTKPIAENFSCFTVDRYGITFIFDAYQLGSYAQGEQRAHVAFDQLSDVVDPKVLAVLVAHDETLG